MHMQMDSVIRAWNTDLCGGIVLCYAGDMASLAVAEAASLAGS